MSEIYRSDYTLKTILNFERDVISLRDYGLKTLIKSDGTKKRRRKE